MIHWITTTNENVRGGRAVRRSFVTGAFLKAQGRAQVPPLQMPGAFCNRWSPHAKTL